MVSMIILEYAVIAEYKVNLKRDHGAERGGAERGSTQLCPTLLLAPLTFCNPRIFCCLQHGPKLQKEVQQTRMV